MATNCRPLTEKLTGGETMRAPVVKDHNFFPVRASSANASPSMSPPKIRSPAVTRSEELFTYLVGNLHCSLPVNGSNALMCGGTSGFGVRPSLKFGPGTIRLHI